MVLSHFWGIRHSLRVEFHVPGYSSSLVIAVKPKLKVFSRGRHVVILNCAKKLP
jgi:hypothetical protein